MNDGSEQTGRVLPDGVPAAPIRKRRPSLLAALPLVVAALALAFPGSGCLNPRPEELPSGADIESGSVEPERETCEGNPLLADCGLPEMDINGAPIDPVPPPEDNVPADSPEPSAPSGGLSLPPRDGGGDAGTGSADGGAP